MKSTKLFQMRKNGVLYHTRYERRFRNHIKAAVFKAGETATIRISYGTGYGANGKLVEFTNEFECGSRTEALRLFELFNNKKEL